MTAATYHAIAIALSLIEAYSLSVHHEQTTIQILQTKLGAEDLRTQDAAAWLEYFELKALEQHEAAHNGSPKSDAFVASKGHLSVSDLLDYISPDQESKTADAQRKQRSKVISFGDKSPEEHLERKSENSTNNRSIEITSVVEERNSEEDKVVAKSSEELSKDNEARYERPICEKRIQDMASEEGWQEAKSKGRSGNIAIRKFNKKRSDLAKLKTKSVYSGYKDRTNEKETVSQRHKATFKTVSEDVSQLEQAGTFGLCVIDDSSKVPPEISVSKDTSVSITSPIPATLTALASKSLSYKEVAVAAPGMVLKPLLERVEEFSDQKTDNQMCISPKQTEQQDGKDGVSVDDSSPDIEDAEGEIQSHKTGPELENLRSDTEVISCSIEKDKPVENGSKLSAAAPPFCPGAYPLANPPSATSVYDVVASQGTVAAPMGYQSVSDRVPCGPRSPAFYRASYTFGIRPEFLNYQIPVSEINGFAYSKTMNPHAPEFVPKKAWEMNAAVEDSNPSMDHPDSSIDSTAALPTGLAAGDLDENISTDIKREISKKNSSDAEKAELVRQILLSFIVKSVRNTSEPPSVVTVSDNRHEFSSNSAEAIANDSAIINIFYGNDGKAEPMSENNNAERQNIIDVRKGKTRDGEGFVLVTKRRRKRQQLTDTVSGLFSQKSVCASVR